MSTSPGMRLCIWCGHAAAVCAMYKKHPSAKLREMANTAPPLQVCYHGEEGLEPGVTLCIWCGLPLTEEPNEHGEAACDPGRLALHLVRSCC